MGHNHSHTHRHAHSHAAGSSNRKRLSIVLLLVLAYAGAEVVGGMVSNSIAMVADAGHMLSDAGSLALSLFALWVAQKPPTAQRTFGFYRTEILAALANGATLVAISIYIFYEALSRLAQPPVVQGGLMLAIAVGGLVINLVGLALLHGGKDENLNVKGAWLHVLSDTLGSVGVIAAGLAVWRFGWYWADPVASILIGLLVIYSSWSLLRETVGVLMEGAPAHIDVDEVRESIKSLGGVVAVHDLHVWTITSGRIAMSGHVTVGEGHFRPQKTTEIRSLIHDRFGIHHSTIQLELDGRECEAMSETLHAHA